MNIKEIITKYQNNIILIILLAIIIYLLTKNQDTFINIPKICQTDCILQGLSESEKRTLSPEQFKLTLLNLEQLNTFKIFKDWFSDTQIKNMINYYDTEKLVKIINLVKKLIDANNYLIFDLEYDNFIYIYDNVLHLDEELIFMCFSKIKLHNLLKISPDELNNLSKVKITKIINEQNINEMKNKIEEKNKKEKEANILQMENYQKDKYKLETELLRQKLLLLPTEINSNITTKNKELELKEKELTNNLQMKEKEIDDNINSRNKELELKKNEFEFKKNEFELKKK
jgi:hypothetical protein